MVYTVTLSESQRVMHWRLIIKEFGLNVQHIYGVENMVADIIIILPSTSVDNYKPITSKSHCSANKVFVIGGEENNEDCFPLNLLNEQIEQQKELEN